MFLYRSSTVRVSLQIIYLESSLCLVECGHIISNYVSQFNFDIWQPCATSLSFRTYIVSA
jgi:hypothetical protein